MALGRIISSISDTVGTFSGIIFQGRTGPYTQIEGVTNRINPNNWKLDLPFSFKVVSVSSPLADFKSPISGIFNLVGAPAGGGLFDEFFLPINPSSFTQDENFSINITPTQRGIISEHNGVVFKDLNISGTFGQRPTNTVSGYEYFNQFRNYLRSYSELKKDPTQKNAQLYFINRKDTEYLIVEPLKFSLERSASSPFLYNYKLLLKVLGMKKPSPAGGILGEIFNKIDNVITKVVDYIQQARFAVLTATQLLKNVKRDFVETVLEPIETAALAFKTLKGLTYTLLDLPNSVLVELSDRTTKAFLDEGKQSKKNGDSIFAQIKFPVNTLQESQVNKYKALDILTPEAKDTITVSQLTAKEKVFFDNAISQSLIKPESFYFDLITNIEETRDNLSDKTGVGDSFYNTFEGRTPEFSPSRSNRTPRADEIDAFVGLELAHRAIQYVLSAKELFGETLDQYINDVETRYDNNIVIPQPQSVDEILLQHGHNLETLAMEYLGDATRWIDIAILNRLKFPYISDDPTVSNVKRSGDKILIPRDTAPDESNIPLTKLIAIDRDFNQTEKNLGVDIKVNKDFDFILTNTNDFRLIAGGDNAGQAVIIKIALEKGSLKYHPTIGVGLSIGQKIREGEDIRDDLINSILSDSRFTGIKNLSFSITNSTINIGLDLMVKNLLTPVPLVLRV